MPVLLTLPRWVNACWIRLRNIWAHGHIVALPNSVNVVLFAAYSWRVTSCVPNPTSKLQCTQSQRPRLTATSLQQRT